MNEKLKELRDKCTEKEAKFLELWVNGQEKFNAYNNAGFKAKNNKVASASICRLLKKVNCSAYFDALKEKRDAETQRTSKITRTVQLKKLDRAYQIAEKRDNPSAMVSATREQNEMLGYHREQAPNAEKEQAKQTRTAAEDELLREFVYKRTADLAREKVIKLRPGDKAG